MAQRKQNQEIGIFISLTFIILVGAIILRASRNF